MDPPSGAGEDTKHGTTFADAFVPAIGASTDTFDQLALRGKQLGSKAAGG